MITIFLLQHFATEFLKKLKPYGLPQHTLSLKVGAPIIPLTNLDVKNGDCNGTRYLVQIILWFLITAKWLGSNNILLIPRIPTLITEGEYSFVIIRLQFPVKLAFAMTFNRALGQSLQRCGTLLPERVRTY